MKEPVKPPLVLAAETLLAEFLSVAPEFGVRATFDWDLQRVEAEHGGDHAAYMREAFATFLEQNLKEPSYEQPPYEELVELVLSAFTALSEAASFPTTDIWSPPGEGDPEGGPAFLAMKLLKEMMERLVAGHIVRYRGERYRYPWEITPDP